MIILFTDFGQSGGYIGQVELVLHRLVPDVRVVNLVSDLPAFQITAASHLLAAFSSQFCSDDVVIAVVDPGVGTDERVPMVLRADGVWYVGPGNGLLDVVASRARQTEWHRVTWRPPGLSNTFHGRDLFAPVAAFLAQNRPVESFAAPVESTLDPIVGKDLNRVVYFDAYGNAITGIRGASLRRDEDITVKGWNLHFASTFGEVSLRQPFWYVNSLGLVELAVNKGSAQVMLGLSIGDDVLVSQSNCVCG